MKKNQSQAHQNRSNSLAVTQDQTADLRVRGFTDGEIELGRQYVEFCRTIGERGNVIGFLLSEREAKAAHSVTMAAIKGTVVIDITNAFGNRQAAN